MLIARQYAGGAREVAQDGEIPGGDEAPIFDLSVVGYLLFPPPSCPVPASFHSSHAKYVLPQQ